VEQNRSKFSNKLGFVLAAAGSAVGLGNIWRFPYLAAKYGGGAFLLTYLILVVTVGFTLMVTEIAIGRKTGLSPYGAYRSLNKKSGIIGVLSFIVPFLIVPYYCVIGGWVLKYLAAFLTGGGSAAAAEGFFSAYIAQPVEPIVWQAIFVVAAALVVVLGVKNGIEKISRILMPVLVLLALGIAVYTMFLPGAIEGIKYYLIPDFSTFSVQTVLAALGQMFYSMSLAMGIMITYGSYLKKEEDLEKSVRHVELFDTGVAFLAGLMIVPAVFVFKGGDQAALSQGPGLMFATLPSVFDSMPMGQVIGVLFFLLVLFAALTSAISLLETVVATVCDHFHFERKRATLVMALVVILVGIPSSLGNGVWAGFTILGMDFLTFMDFITNSVLMPITALLTCVFVAYVLKPKSVIEEVKRSSAFKHEKLYVFVLKYLAPIAIVAILISSVLNSFGVIKL
jgi:NSS family neurotransmitter:Na+ symporter